MVAVSWSARHVHHAGVGHDSRAVPGVICRVSLQPCSRSGRGASQCNGGVATDCLSLTALPALLCSQGASMRHFLSHASMRRMVFSSVQKLKGFTNRALLKTLPFLATKITMEESR